MSKTSRTVLKTTQCYRVDADGEHQRFYLGDMTADLPEWCQEKADTHQQLVIMDSDGEVETFNPTPKAKQRPAFLP